MDEVLSLRRLGELGQEVGLNCVAKELVLGLLAITVHHIPHDGEVDVLIFLGLQNEDVILVVPVGVHEGQHALHHLQSLVLGQTVENLASKKLIDEVFQDFVHLQFCDGPGALLLVKVGNAFRHEGTVKLMVL